VHAGGTLLLMRCVSSCEKHIWVAARAALRKLRERMRCVRRLSSSCWRAECSYLWRRNPVRAQTVEGRQQTAVSERKPQNHKTDRDATQEPLHCATILPPKFMHHVCTHPIPIYQTIRLCSPLSVQGKPEFGRSPMPSCIGGRTEGLPPLPQKMTPHQHIDTTFFCWMHQRGRRGRFNDILI
jgi:hypothetical protein